MKFHLSFFLLRYLSIETKTITCLFNSLGSSKNLFAPARPR